MTADTVTAALVAACQELQNPTRNKSADTGRFAYAYADLGAVLDVVRPVLARHGLAVLQDVRTADGMVQVFTIIQHTSGEQIMFGPLAGRVDTGGWQALGSAITYARRYALMAALGLAAEGEDDDARGVGPVIQQVTSVPESDPWYEPMTTAEVAAELGGRKIASQASRARFSYDPATPKQLDAVRKIVAREADARGVDPLELLNDTLTAAGLTAVDSSEQLVKGAASAVIEALGVKRG